MNKNYLAFGQPDFGSGEIKAVSRILRSGWVGMGPEVLQFENELGDYLQAPNVITVNSCTSALFLSLLASDVKPGDEVICPSFTWCSTANVILYLGAKPVFADISPDTFNLTSETIQKKITDKTKAIIIVHMGGLASDVRKIRKKVSKHINIIEDAAHALGANYPDGKPVGSSGNLTCFSFYANKNLSTGEGGAITTPDKKIANRLSTLRLNGLTKDAWNRYSEFVKHVKIDFPELGYKMNYTDLQAAIGRVQLRRQNVFYKTRLRIAKRYEYLIKRSDLNIQLQNALTSKHHARHLFQILLPDKFKDDKRDELVSKLREKNIGASVHYYPLHQYDIYKNYASSLPVTESIGRSIITLPISVRMKMADVNYTAETFINLIQKES